MARCPTTSCIAVVDDNAPLRACLVELLQARGYRVAEFANVHTACASLTVEPPDLMIVDVQLPDGSGLDVIQTVRNESGVRVPAIVISGLRDEEDLVRGLSAGAADYLTKPFTMEELLARIRVRLGESARMPPLKLDGAGRIFDRFRTIRELGRGGYGQVLLVEDTTRGEVVALKTLSEGDDPTAHARFIREAYALAGIHDRHVVGIREVGVHRRRPFYVMEYVRGETLSEHVRRTGPVTEKEARALARGVTAALGAIEAVGFHHRDLKPANVMLRDGDIERPVLIDFGLVRWECERGLTNPDDLVGTAAYLAPETIANGVADRRSDLFSLGLTLRFALSGTDVFHPLAGANLLRAIVTGPIPPPPIELSVPFAAMLARLCDIDPSRRPGSAAETRSLLELAESVAPSTERARLSNAEAAGARRDTPTRRARPDDYRGAS